MHTDRMLTEEDVCVLADVRARAGTFMHRYCRLPRTRSIGRTDIRSASAPLPLRQVLVIVHRWARRKSTTIGGGAEKERRRFFGRIIFGDGVSIIAAIAVTVRDGR